MKVISRFCIFLLICSFLHIDSFAFKNADLNTTTQTKQSESSSGTAEKSVFLKLLELPFQMAEKVERFQKVDNLVKDRDFILYCYKSGYIDLNTYNDYISRYSSEYETYANVSMLSQVVYDHAFEDELYKNQTSGQLVEASAKLIMASIYQSMVGDPDVNSLKLKTEQELAQTNNWYLCQFGCGASTNKKVYAWGNTCTHTTNSSNYSYITVTRTEVAPDGEKQIYYQTIKCRRDCSGYVFAVLANLGFDPLWESTAFNYTESGTGELVGLIHKFEQDPDFDVYSYDSTRLQKGDIVLKNGHVEIFMGFDDTSALKNENTHVYKYSWGSSQSVLNNLRGDRLNPTFEATTSIEDTRYDNTDEHRYQYIIRYKKKISSEFGS
jgi:hypothetical protein